MYIIHDPVVKKSLIRNTKYFAVNSFCSVCLVTSIGIVFIDWPLQNIFIFLYDHHLRLYLGYLYVGKGSPNIGRALQVQMYRFGNGDFLEVEFLP